jgi:hypothetical protein
MSDILSNLPFAKIQQLGSLVGLIESSSSLHYAALGILTTSIGIGFLIHLNALRFEAGKHFKSLLMVLCLIFNISLLVMYAPDRVNAILGFVVLYVVHSVFSLIYGLVRSKQIYNSMVQSNTITDKYGKFFWIAVILMIIGEVLTFIFLTVRLKQISNSEAYIGGASQIFMFLGFCFWIYFLNSIERSMSSPRVVRRMGWAAIGIIILSIVIILVIVLLFFVIYNELTRIVQESVNGNKVVGSVDTISNSIIAAVISLLILLFGVHLCYVTMLGYTFWDIWKLSKIQYQKDYEAYHGNARSIGLETPI